MKILLIEDEPRIASFLRRGLTTEGFVVDVAENGRDGLRAARGSNVDLVLLDLVLPDVSGEDILRQLDEEQPHLPVIVVSAKDTISDRVSSLEAGANDYLIKPFSFAELLARIQLRLRDASVGDRSA